MPLKTYLINKLINKQFRLNGILPSSRLPHKHRLRQNFGDHVLYTPDQLPPKVDLRPDMTPVEDQSQIGSCTANSIAGAYEYLTKKDTGSNTDVSRLFIYYNARVKANNSTSVTDSGCSMTDTIEALEEFGTCLESIWPYDISKVNVRPNNQAYQKAAEHKITEALQVNVDLNEMKSCLAQGFPIAFGLKLFSSFDKAAQTGVVPMPNSGDGSRQSDGSHALLAVGYSDQSSAFIVRNSWGQNWGDKGYCYIPYDYMTDTDLCFDMWTIRKVANDDFGQEHWHFNDAVNLLHHHLHLPHLLHHHRGQQSDNDNDDNHTIEVFNENDNDNSGYGGDNDYGRGNDDYSDRYQNDQRNDNAYYGDQNQYDSYQDNNYNSGGDFFNQNDNQYPDDRNNYNSGGDFFNQNYDQYRGDRNNYDDYSRYN